MASRDRSPNTESGKKNPSMYEGIITNFSQQVGSEKIIQTKITNERQFLGQNVEVVCFLLAFNLEVKDVEIDSLQKNRKELFDIQREDKKKLKSLEDENLKLKQKLDKDVKNFNIQIQDKDRYIQELLTKQELQKKDKQQMEQQYEEYLEQQKQRLEQERRSQEEKYQQKISEMEQDIEEIHRKNNQMQYRHEEKIKNLYQKHTEENQSALVKYQVMEKQLETIKHQHQEEITKYTLIQEELTSKYNKIFEQNIEIKHQLEVKENQIIKINSELKDQEIRFLEEKQKYSSFSKEQTLLDSQIQSLNNDIEELKRKNKKLEKEYKDLQAENAQLIQDINKEKFDKNESNNKYQGLERQLTQSEQTQKQLHNENDQLLNEIDELRNTISNLEQDIEQKIHELNESRQQNNHMLTHIQNLENENNSLSIEKNQLQEYYDQQQEENKSLIKKQEQLEMKISYTSTQIQMLDIKDGKNKKLIKELEEEQSRKIALITELQNQIKLKDEEIGRLNLIVKELNEEIERLKKLINQFQENGNLKTEADKKIQHLMSQLLTKEEEINQLQKKITELELVQLKFQDYVEKYKNLEDQLKDQTNAIAQINQLNILNQRSLPEYKYFSKFIDTFNTTLEQLQIHHNIDQDLSCIGILKILESRIVSENQKIVNYQIKIQEYTEKIKFIELSQPQKMDKFNTDIQNDLVNAKILQVRPNTPYPIFNQGFNDQVQTLLKQVQIEKICSVQEGFQIIFDKLKTSQKQIQHLDNRLMAAVEGQQNLFDEVNQLKQIIEKMENESLLLKNQFDQLNAEIDYFIKNKSLLIWKQEEQEGCLKQLVQNFKSEKCALFDQFQLDPENSIKDVVLQLTNQIKEQKCEIAKLEERITIQENQYNELIQSHEQAKISEQNALNEVLKQVGAKIFHNQSEYVDNQHKTIYMNVFSTLNEFKVSVYKQLNIETHLSIEQVLIKLQETIQIQQKQLSERDSVIDGLNYQLQDVRQKLQNEMKRKATLKLQLEDLNKADQEFSQIKDTKIRDAVKLEMRKQIEKFQKTSLFDLVGQEDRENVFINEYLIQKEKLLCDLDLDNDSTIRQLLRNKSRSSSQIRGQKREFFTFTVNDKFILELIIKTFEQGEDLTSQYLRTHFSSIRNILLRKVIIIFTNQITELSFKLSNTERVQNNAIEEEPQIISQQNNTEQFELYMFRQIIQMIEKTDFKVIRGPYKLTGYVLRDEIMKKVKAEFKQYKIDIEYEQKKKIKTIADLIEYQKNTIKELSEELAVQRKTNFDYQVLILEKIKCFYKKGEMDDSFKDDLILSYIHRNNHDNGCYKDSYSELWQQLIKFNELSEFQNIYLSANNKLYNLISKIQILINNFTRKVILAFEQGIIYYQHQPENVLIDLEKALKQSIQNIRTQRAYIEKDISQLCELKSFNDDEVEFRLGVFYKVYQKIKDLWSDIKEILSDEINFRNHHVNHGEGVVGEIIDIWNAKLGQLVAKIEEVQDVKDTISFEEIIDLLIQRIKSQGAINDEQYVQNILNLNISEYNGNDKILIAVKQKIVNQTQIILNQEIKTIRSWIQQFNYNSQVTNECQYLMKQWFVNQRELVYQEARNEHLVLIEKISENIRKGQQIGDSQLEKTLFEHFQLINQQTLKERQSIKEFFEFVEKYQYYGNFQPKNQQELIFHKQIEKQRESIFKRILNSIQTNHYNESKEDIEIQKAVEVRMLIQQTLENPSDESHIKLLQQYVNLQYTFANQLVNNLTHLSNAFSRIQKSLAYKEEIQKHTAIMRQQKEEFIQKYTQLENIQPQTQISQLLELSLNIMQGQLSFIEGYTNSLKNKILVISKDD